MPLPGSAVELLSWLSHFALLSADEKLQLLSKCEQKFTEKIKLWDFISATVCCSCRIFSIMYSEGLVLPMHQSPECYGFCQHAVDTHMLELDISIDNDCFHDR